MNSTELQEFYNSSNLQSLIDGFKKAPTYSPDVYFDVLDGYLEPYISFVKALFATPDHFANFPYTTATLPQPHPLIENFRSCRSRYQADFQTLHSVLGVAGEAIELYFHTDPENKAEETGDLMFYACSLFFTTPITVTELKRYHNPHPDYASHSPEMFLTLGMEAIDLSKKVIFYQLVQKGKHIDMAKTWEALARVFSCDKSLDKRTQASEAINTVHSVVRSNIKKLIVRYPSLTFSSEHAYARADKS